MAHEVCTGLATNETINMPMQTYIGTSTPTLEIVVSANQRKFSHTHYIHVH